MSTMESVHILLAEDNKADVRLIRIALEGQNGPPVKISVVSDGAAAINFVRQAGFQTVADLPDLVVLDLNLPKYSGPEILKAIRESEYMSQLPVIMFSSAPEDLIRDKVHEFEVEADQYFTKPSELKGFLALVKQFPRYALSREAHFTT
jgi:DNA-binding response OmpR family regulator